MFKTLIEANQALEEQIRQRKRAEEQFHALLESLPDALAIVDRDSNIVFVNTRTEKLFGYSRDELSGHQVELLVPEPHDASTASGTGVDWERYARRKDGSEFPVEVITSPIETEDGDLIAIHIRDITERVKIVKSLEEERRLLRSLMDNIPDLIYFKDAQSRFNYINLAHAHRLGLDNPADVIGKSDADFLDPQLAKFFLEEEQHVITSGEPVINREELNPDLDGTPRWLSATKVPVKDSNGHVTGIVGVTRDITESKQNETALRNSEEQFRSIFTYAGIGMALVGLDGQWLKVNPAVCEIVGYTEQELLSKRFQDMTHPDDLDRDLNAVKQLLSGEVRSYQIEKRYFHKQGHEVWVLLSVSLVRDTHGHPLHFVSQIQNITDRKQAEATLKLHMDEDREFQSRLTALHEITIELMNISDLDGFYKRAVELGLQRLGFERLALFLYDSKNSMAMGTYGTDIQGQLVPEHHLRFDPSRLAGILMQALQSEQRVFVHDNTTLFSDLKAVGKGWNAGAVLWSGNEMLGWLAVDNGVHHKPLSQSLLDVLALYALTLGALLAQKRAQIALLEQRNLLRTLIDSLPNNIYIKDLNCRFILANKATIASMAGTSDEDVIGKSDFDFMEPEVAEGFFADEQALLKSGETIINREESAIDADGNKIYLSISKIPLRDIHGQVIGLIGTNHNITERKQVQQQALELQKEREQVKTLSDFIRDVSHDFRTPLATINSSLYLMTRTTDAEKQKRYFDSAEEQIGHLTQLIDRLLIIGRLDSQSHLEFQRIDVNRIISDVFTKVAYDAQQKQIRVETLLSENSLMIQANLQELSLAFTELGRNAVIYTPSNGTITIRSRQKNDEAVIQIFDSGIGIPGDELHLIFQRLYRVDKARSTTSGGTGLGLSIVKRIIELHHGRIEVESFVGKGSIFRIFLPLSE